jgi:hypothetical protein
MRCARCGGLMNHEWFMNTMSEETSWSYDGWRCVDCGDIIDPLILLNRSHQHQKAKTLEEEEETAVGAARRGH